MNPIKKIQPLKVARFAAKGVTAFGVGYVMRQLFNDNVTTETTAQKAAVNVAFFVVGMAIVDRTDAVIDNFFNDVDEAVAGAKIIIEERNSTA